MGVAAYFSFFARVISNFATVGTAGPALTVPVELLWQVWCGWCASEGRRENGTKEMFGRDLMAAFPSVVKVRPRDERGLRYWAYSGIALGGDKAADDDAE